MSNAFSLIFLFIFMFALIGMNVFGGSFTEAHGFSEAHGAADGRPCPHALCADGLEEKPRQHFDYTVPAMITVFVLTTGEWVEALKPVAEIYGPMAAGFFIPVVLIGKYLLLNLLVALILTEFADSADSAETPRDSTERRGSDSTERGSNERDRARHHRGVRP